MPETSSPSAVDVLTQLVTGPSLQDVASKVLRPALKTLYPSLDLDPQLSILVTPTWQVENERVIPGPSQYESLTDVLVRLGLSGTHVTWMDGEHFLTLHPEIERPVQLPVKVDTLGTLINELAPLLFVAYREQQIDYWNESIPPAQPRWYQLSDALRSLWNLNDSVDLDADQRAMALAVFTSPDKLQRHPTDPYKTRACLIDVDQGDGADRKHLNVLDMAVLMGSLAERTLIVTYSLSRGFQSFDSLDALGLALGDAYAKNAGQGTLNWRLYEPEGNFFDQQACTLIALEADVIGSISFFPSSAETDFYPYVGTVGNPSEPPPRLQSRFDSLRPLLPPWLDKATAADQTCYSRHLLDLVVIQHQNAGKTFQGEVPDIHAFALDALAKQILKDHPQAGDVKVDNIEISITNLVVWGTFVLPGNTETLTLSLTELALQNLSGLPLGNKTVCYQDGTPVPDWMSVSYMEKLVNTVDIGATYPAMLKQKLVDDATRALELQQLYTRQLSVELPLLALQHKIRGEAQLDEQGYRYVIAAIAAHATDRQVDGQDIEIRPLAFTRKNTTPDEVVNMFVIGPRQADKGPCLLYRPLLDPPLIQFPSPTNLLYAIKHSRAIRESVLAWLPDGVRFNYSQYVFPAKLPSVWTVPQLLVDPTAAIDLSGAVSLGTRVIDKDVMATLFKANVQAMITQADRQSVSNAEARWASLKQGGWMIFNAALPFLGRSVGTAAWIWQIMEDLQELSDSANKDPASIDWTALADILLALGMVLAHRAATGNRPPRESKTPSERPRPLPAKPVPQEIKVLQLPDISGTLLPAAHETSLNAIGALNRSRPGLGSHLDSLQIRKPEGLGNPQSTGPHRHLYAHGQKWYATVGERWFEVMLNDEEQVQIIDTRQQSPRTGPLLTHNASGQWFIDLRLRLRGGGLRNRRKKLQQENRAQLTQKKAALAAFDTTLQVKRTQLKDARKAMLEASPEDRASARQTFLDTLDQQVQDYGVHIQELKALNTLEPVPNYRTAMLDRLSLQLFLMQSWLDEQSSEFRNSLTTTLALLDEESPAQPAERAGPFERMTDLTQGMIDKVELARTRFEELGLLGREAVEVSRVYKAKLPPFALDDLKLLQITLGQELCLKAGPAETLADARLALVNLVEDAALNIQSALDLSTDESLNDLGERIETMSNLAEQFTVIDQRFLDLVSEYPEHIVTERVEQVRVRIAGFYKDTVNQLANLLREQRLVEPLPGPSRPSAPPTRKIIKTRYKGTLVGEARKDTKGQQTDLVDVKSPLTGKVIATFHEKTPGVWLERVTRQEPPTQAKPDLTKSIETGQGLLDGVAAFQRRTEAHVSRAPRIPIEIEEIYHQHAARLREAMDAIDSALTASNLTDEGAASLLSKDLETAAAALYKKGISTRIQLIKQQPPTAARIEWLKGKGEVVISKTAARRRLKGPTKDYLDEYEVLDHKTRKVLWYAHFHYANVTDPADSFTAAHLKTVEQRRLGGSFDFRDKSNQELVAIYRSEISRTLAAPLFFT
ncbi:hypothetical protein BJ917_4122 [Pseudomonas sp. WPR_5_2]|uniref:dermonecrotic toxin domain-containing protein n=1 Tax=Pseudomonas sp. WPR_5_2 TaxID=1907371 RepID=UPI000EAC80FC|nr:DUF6543 domain-containing protein [Pseudomonas sp. WPR_5_2]RKS20227.1 hypothetical protein BJ917_4122 [Pseudomonas sp. WPR_5_2]